MRSNECCIYLGEVQSRLEEVQARSQAGRGAGSQFKRWVSLAREPHMFSVGVCDDVLCVVLVFRYLEKQDFLHRSDLRQFELEKELRLKRFKKIM